MINALSFTVSLLLGRPWLALVAIVVAGVSLINGFDAVDLLLTIVVDAQSRGIPYDVPAFALPGYLFSQYGTEAAELFIRLGVALLLTFFLFFYYGHLVLKKGSTALGALFYALSQIPFQLTVLAYALATFAVALLLFLAALELAFFFWPLSLLLGLFVALGLFYLTLRFLLLIPVAVRDTLFFRHAAEDSWRFSGKHLLGVFAAMIVASVVGGTAAWLGMLAAGPVEDVYLAMIPFSIITGLGFSIQYTFLSAYYRFAAGGAAST